MAIKQDSVVEHIATLTVQETGKLIGALMELRDLYEWATSAGIVFTNFPTLFGEDSGNDLLKHIDPTMLNQVLGFILGADDSVADSVMNHLTGTTVSGGDLIGKTYWEVIEMVRRNGS